MSIRHLAASASADDIAAALAEDGAAIVDALAPASLMDRVAQEIAAIHRGDSSSAATISRDAARAEQAD